MAEAAALPADEPTRGGLTALRDVSIALACVVLANILVSAGERGDRVALFQHLMMGPFGLWLEVAKEPHHIIGSLGVLIPAAYASVLPLAAYAVYRHRGALAVGAACWFASGLMFVAAGA